MKSKLFLIGLIVCLTIFNAFPQTSWDRSMIPIMGEGYRQFFYTQSENQNLIYMELDLLFSSSPKEIIKILSKGNYVVSTFGDFRIKSTKISAYRRIPGSDNWIFVKENSPGDYSASISFYSDKVYEYRFILEILQCSDDLSGGHYGFAIYESASEGISSGINRYYADLFSFYDLNRKNVTGLEKADSKYEAVHIEIGKISRGKNEFCIRKLTEGWVQYGFLADCEGLKNVDIKLYTKDYKNVWQLDKFANEIAEYEYFAHDVPITEEYKIEIVPTFEYGSNEGWYSLIIYHP